MTSTVQSTPAHRTRIRRIDRTGSAKPVVIFVIVALVVASLATFMVVVDGRAEERQIEQSPPKGSVEGNLAMLAAWAAEPIRAAIESTGSLPDEEAGGKLLESLASKARPEFYPPTPASPDGNPTYRITNNGFELVFPGREGKPVVCRFSSEGAYEGATGEEAANEADNSVADPLLDDQ